MLPLIPLLAVGLAATSAYASPPEFAYAGPTGVSPPPLDCDGEIFFEQLPDDGGYLAAQDDLCYPLRFEHADDFVGTGDWITSVGWWGAYWSGNPLSPDAIRITLYAVDADGCPGESLSSQRIEEYEESRVGSEASFCVRLTEPFETRDGIAYALSILPELCFPPQTGWATAIGNGQEGCFRSAFLDYPDWVPISETFTGAPYELAFVLVTDDVVPIERGSWGRIKALYTGADTRASKGKQGRSP